MSQFPKQAKVVIIGAGITGNCIAGHLAERGWKDMVLIDKGPLPNPGGSTGHASNFIFPVDHGKAMAQITCDSMKQYEEMGVQRTCGGIELARTEESMEELKRRMCAAKNWGIESELLDPDGVCKLFPWVNKDKILGSAGCVRPKTGESNLSFSTQMESVNSSRGLIKTKYLVDSTSLP